MDRADSEGRRMICFVDMEHEEVLGITPHRVEAWPLPSSRVPGEDETERLMHLGRRSELKWRFEEISGHPCLVQHYSQVTEEKLKDWGIEALLLSGCATSWDKYDFDRCQELFRIIREGEWPVIGFCGGHQFIGYAYDVPSGPMGPLPEGMEPPRPGDTSGMLREYGYMEVETLQKDPLFDGLGDPPVLWESHWWEVKAVPPGFSLLATRDTCRIQAMKHEERVLYSVQFHPEAYSEEHQDGKRLLENFFRIAGLI